MEKGFGRALVVTVSAAVALAWFGGIGSSAAAVAAGPEREAEARLRETIQRAIRAEGPFFTPAEQAVIRAKCGYGPGEWDGFDIHISGKVLTCRNGKRVDDPEVRALMEVAGPRIGRRVSAVMNRPEVRDAIGRVASEATREAMAELGKRDWGRR